VVVADACQDQTGALTWAAGAGVLEIAVANVGAARAAGLAEVLRLAGRAPQEVWLATTDADTVVPPS
jgi:hypothetical protein